MPGRRRFQVRASASGGQANAIRALLSAAASDPSIYAVDQAPETRATEAADPSTGRTHESSMNVRLKAGASETGIRNALRAVGNGKSARVEIVEHECFHGLEDEPDAKPCEEGLTRWLEIDGVEQVRGRNGK